MKYIFILLSLLFVQDSIIVFEAKPNSLKNWFVVDDGVMGGLSKGKISSTKNYNLLFTGEVSLKNNGGFSSIRKTFDPIDVSSGSYVYMKIKGDGNPYQLRTKSTPFQRYSYTKSFKTSGEWEIIKIRMDQMTPTFRGVQLNRESYPGKTLSEIAILIGNKKEQTFRLEIESIYISN